jgi:hypothetical protein
VCGGLLEHPWWCQPIPLGGARNSLPGALPRGARGRKSAVRRPREAQYCLLWGELSESPVHPGRARGAVPPPLWRAGAALPGPPQLPGPAEGCTASAPRSRGCGDLGRGSLLTCGDVEQNPGPGVSVPWERTLAQRRKQIAFGKSLPGYQTYILLVPQRHREEGNPYHPSTPRADVTCSCREWCRGIAAWRRALHKWDCLSHLLHQSNEGAGEQEPPLEASIFGGGGRGKDLLTCGDVEANPGPPKHDVGPIRSNAGRRARSSTSGPSVRGRSPDAPSDLDPVFVPPVTGGAGEEGDLSHAMGRASTPTRRMEAGGPAGGWNVPTPLPMLDMLHLRAAPIHHIPAALQDDFVQCLTASTRRYCQDPSDANLFALLALPKLTLRPPTLRGKFAQEHLVSGIRRRLQLFLAGDLVTLWDEALADVRARPGGESKQKTALAGVIHARFHHAPGETTGGGGCIAESLGHNPFRRHA